MTTRTWFWLCAVVLWFSACYVGANWLRTQLDVLEVERLNQVHCEEPEVNPAIPSTMLHVQ